MKKFFFFFLLVMVCFSAKASNAESVNKTIRKLKKNDSYNAVYSIEEIVGGRFVSGTYHTVGYVSKVYECPPCEPDRMCKPCMNNNIVISHKKKLVESYDDVREDDLIVFVDDSSGFYIGEKRIFLITILNVRTINQQMNNVKLIYSEKVK